MHTVCIFVYVWAQVMVMKFKEIGFSMVMTGVIRLGGGAASETQLFAKTEHHGKLRWFQVNEGFLTVCYFLKQGAVLQKTGLLCPRLSSFKVQSAILVKVVWGEKDLEVGSMVKKFEYVCLERRVTANQCKVVQSDHLYIILTFLSEWEWSFPVRPCPIHTGQIST